VKPLDIEKYNQEDLIKSIRKFIPEGLPSDLREEICQDLVVAVLSKEITVENVPNVIKKFITDARKNYGTYFLSLDKKIGDSENLTLGGVLTTERKLGNAIDNKNLDHKKYRAAREKMVNYKVIRDKKNAILLAQAREEWKRLTSKKRWPKKEHMQRFDTLLTICLLSPAKHRTKTST